MDDAAEFENPNLGTCCVCGGSDADGAKVRTILMLHKKSPTGRGGWGCVACGLPSDGAVAVVCDACCDRHGQELPKVLKFACKGYPATDGRIPIEELRGEHEHNLAFHPELEDVGFTE